MERVGLRACCARAGFSNTASSAFVGRGVVCVALNYRVGLHGFLHTDGATNLALRDVILGLEWVRDHVSAFGGDPRNVTIMGKSAGCGGPALRNRGQFDVGVVA